MIFNQYEHKIIHHILLSCFIFLGKSGKYHLQRIDIDFIKEFLQYTLENPSLFTLIEQTGIILSEHSRNIDERSLICLKETEAMCFYEV